MSYANDYGVTFGNALNAASRVFAGTGATTEEVVAYAEELGQWLIRKRAEGAKYDERRQTSDASVRSSVTPGAVRSRPAPKKKGQRNESGPDELFNECPHCGGAIWDNRNSRKGNQPHYRCRDQDDCQWAYWIEADEEPY